MCGLIILKLVHFMDVPICINVLYASFVLMNKLTLAVLFSVVALTVVVYSATPVESQVADHSRMHNRGDLAFKSIPANDFMHLYDSTPYPIAGMGHIALKVNCDQAGNGAVSVLLGIAPEFQEFKLNDNNRVDPLSTLGTMCLYHIDLPPTPEMQITDIAIKNPSNERVRLGPTASYTLFIDGLGEPVEEMDEMG